MFFLPSALRRRNGKVMLVTETRAFARNPKTDRVSQISRSTRNVVVLEQILT